VYRDEYAKIGTDNLPPGHSFDIAERARQDAALAAILNLPEHDGIQRFHLKGGMSASAGLVSTVPGYVINLYLMTTAVARRVFGKVNFGASKWAPLAFFPVCVSLFLLSGVVNEKIKGQFEDENAKFRPLPPVPDTGC
tara:strand:- start:118 stop:531 length:414 start_codon:yes stop_codon:yes gene_type:complete